MLACLPAVPEALKVYMTEFLVDFEEFLTEMATEESSDDTESVIEDSE